MNRAMRSRRATTTKRVGITPTVVLCALLGTSTASAQNLDNEPIVGFDRGLGVITGVRYDAYTEDRPDPLGQRLGQLNVYGQVAALLSPGIRLDVASGWNETNWHTLGDLSTANDTKVELSLRPLEHIMIGGGINVPTGLTSLDLEELRLSQGVASRMKGYPTNKFGEGVDFNARASYGVRTGSLAAAAGVGCLFKGHYTIVAGQDDYDPGDQITFSLGTDVGSPQRMWRTNASYTLYAADESGGADAFEFGNRLRLETLFRDTSPALGLLLRVRAILRADSQLFQPGAVLNAETREDQGSELYVDGTTDVTLAGPLGVLVLAGARWFGESDTGGGAGHRVDLGGGVRLRFAHTTFSLRGRGSFGRLDVADLDPQGAIQRIDFDGWSVDGNVVWRTW